MSIARWPATALPLILFAPAAALAASAPSGWILAGSHPEYYDVGLTAEATHEGAASAYLASRAAAPSGFGTLMQVFAADEYRGQRLHLSGFVRAEAIAGWAGLWMRVDGSGRQPLAFDNMQDRPIKGTADWDRYDIVLDVPLESTNIAFGVLLHGEGKLYLDSLAFEVVPQTVATTTPTDRLPTAPTNLGFER